jgi:hypothetical protein
MAQLATRAGTPTVQVARGSNRQRMSLAASYVDDALIVQGI